ncbi:MAG: hypothetical protein DRO13_06600 [Thermoprotei archaeon]|nr:MAG: hypothetical protein DRO13_06600 [Thermoprotei archaeon]
MGWRGGWGWKGGRQTWDAWRIWPGRGPFSYLPPWQRPGWIFGRGYCRWLLGWPWRPYWYPPVIPPIPPYNYQYTWYPYPIPPLYVPRYWW